MRYLLLSSLAALMMAGCAFEEGIDDVDEFQKSMTGFVADGAKMLTGEDPYPEKTHQEVEVTICVERETPEAECPPAQ